MKKLSILISLLVLSACAKTEQTHTVSEYFKNPALMNADHKNCHDNYGSIGQTPNCINADQAHRQYRDMSGGCRFDVAAHKFATPQQCEDDYYNHWVAPK
jgi:hypothetical protein